MSHPSLFFLSSLNSDFCGIWNYFLTSSSSWLSDGSSNMEIPCSLTKYYCLTLESSFSASCICRREVRMFRKLWYFFSIFWWWLRHWSAALVPIKVDMDLKILSMRLSSLLKKCYWCSNKNRKYSLFSSFVQWPMFIPCISFSRHRFFLFLGELSFEPEHSSGSAFVGRCLTTWMSITTGNASLSSMS